MASRMAAAQDQQIDHGPRAVLRAASLFQPVPHLIETRRPPTLRPPLLQRRRTGQRSRLLAQHIQVMLLQVQHLLLLPEATFMPRHAGSLIPDLHMRRVHLRLDLAANRRRR